jgi:hypothetical protein
MIEIPWLQLSGAITGGLVGSFSGFVANSFQERRLRVRVRRNIACALVGEIGALSDYIENNYLALLRASVETVGDQPEHPAHFFRGDRDYMPVFRSIGATVGYLPTPLPRDVVTWYTSLATTLERAHALHDMAIQRDPRLIGHAHHVARMQQQALIDLIGDAKPLLERLDAL